MTRETQDYNDTVVLNNSQFLFLIWKLSFTPLTTFCMVKNCSFFFVKSVFAERLCSFFKCKYLFAWSVKRYSSLIFYLFGKGFVCVPQTCLVLLLSALFLWVNVGFCFLISRSQLSNTSLACCFDLNRYTYWLCQIVESQTRTFSFVRNLSFLDKRSGEGVIWEIAICVYLLAHLLI